MRGARGDAGVTVVTVIADVAIAATAHRLTNPLVLWIALRELAAGSGRVDLAQVREASCLLHWRRDKVRRAVIAGQGRFWHRRRHGDLWLVGTAKVASGLGVSSVRSAFHVSLRDLQGSIGIVRARLFLRAVASLRNGAPIANLTMATMVGRTTRTVKAWKRRQTGVGVRRNLLRIRKRELLDRCRPVGHTWRQWKHAAPPVLWSWRTVRIGRERWLCRQLPSSLIAKRCGGAHSLLRRTNRALRGDAAPSVHSRGGSTRPRRYLLARHRRREPLHAALYRTEVYGVTQTVSSRVGLTGVWEWLNEDHLRYAALARSAAIKAAAILKRFSTVDV